MFIRAKTEVMEKGFSDLVGHAAADWEKLALFKTLIVEHTA